MADTCDDVYDILFLGTSLPHCISSYTYSKNKLKVLIVDSNSSYGSSLRTFNYSSLCKTFNTEPKTELLLLDKFFNIDITPKFILADGKMKELILKNNIDNLVSFTNVQGSFVYRDKCLRLVPTDEKSSVTSKLISFMQKPRVANFFWNVRKYCEMKETYYKEAKNERNGEDNDNCTQQVDTNELLDDDIEEDIMQRLKHNFTCKKTMLEEFQYYNLSPGSIEIIGHAIALNLNDLYLYKNPIETYDKIYYFIRSLLCLNDKMSPFIYPLYGLSEICQAFSRRAGQYGCTFMLNVNVNEIKKGDKILLCEVNSTEINSVKNNTNTEDNAASNINAQTNYSSEIENIENGATGNVDDDKKTAGQNENNSITELLEQKLNVKTEINNCDPIFTVKLTENGNKRVIKCNKIIAESFYFKNEKSNVKEIITHICIVKGNVKLIESKYKISSCHVILLASEFKRRNDIFIAVLGERENVAPENYKVAIISTVKETNNYKNELDFVVQMMGDVKENICFVREIKEGIHVDEDVMVTKDADQTTHFETLYDEVVRSGHIQ